MFSRYWGDRYFAPRYWPNAGDVIVITYPRATKVFFSEAQVRVFEVPRAPVIESVQATRVMVSE